MTADQRSEFLAQMERVHGKSFLVGWLWQSYISNCDPEVNDSVAASYMVKMDQLEIERATTCQVDTVD